VASEILDARLEGGKYGVVVSAVVGDEFAELIQLAEVPAVVHVAVHDLLVG
jgi:hypothetical protein